MPYMIRGGHGQEVAFVCDKLQRCKFLTEKNI